MIVIVDYGAGNLASIKNMFKRVGEKNVSISSDQEVISKADKLILPGVGSFDAGMQKLMDSDLIDTLNRKVVIEKTPILGICLGMQLMTKSSEEGLLSGLGWLDAEVLKFKDIEKLKIPHMGWNYTYPTKENKLLEYTERLKFYYVHSYYVKCNEKEDVLATCDYGVTFDSAFNHENIYGMQFHPEKSLKFGMKVFKSFAEL